MRRSASPNRVSAALFEKFNPEDNQLSNARFPPRPLLVKRSGEKRTRTLELASEPVRSAERSLPHSASFTASRRALQGHLHSYLHRCQPMHGY